MTASLPIACALSLVERRNRARELTALAQEAVVRQRTDRGLRFRFRKSPVLQAEVIDLTTREKECCPFFDFRIQTRGGELVLDVTVPSEARPIVEELFSGPDVVS